MPALAFPLLESLGFWTGWGLPPTPGCPLAWPGRAWPRTPPPSAGSKCAAPVEAGLERSGGSQRGSWRPPSSGPAGHSGTGVREGVPGLHPSGSHGPPRRWGGCGRSWSVPDSLGWLRPQPPPPPSCGEVGLIGACAAVCGGDAAKRGAGEGDEGKRSHVGRGASCVGGTTFFGFQNGSPLWPCLRDMVPCLSPQGQYLIFLFPLQSPGVPP